MKIEERFDSIFCACNCIKKIPQKLLIPRESGLSFAREYAWRINVVNLHRVIERAIATISVNTF